MRPKNINILLLFTLFTATSARSQVQVSKEPYHKPVLVNKYIRLLDVWLKPKDTTAFHIHSTPSAFLYFTANKISTQLMGGNWSADISEPGKSWYKSFAGKDSLVHRVCNSDTVPFHVTDIELLSSYKPGEAFNPLPFDILYENEKLVTYLLRPESLKGEVFTDRGPMVAAVVSGAVAYFNLPTNENKKLIGGEFLYIRPGTHFSFTATGTEKLNMVLFELK